MDSNFSWYDPPSGWQFGFPKPWPVGLSVTQENLKTQLTRDGYPAKDMALALKHTRFGGFYEKTTD
jgi:hypothetical protein